MYKIKKGDETVFIGGFGKCWIWLRDQFGWCAVKEIMDMGYKIEKVRK